MALETATAPATAPGQTERLSFGKKLAYASGSFGEQMIFNPATSFVVFFYTDVVGLAAATVGSILLFSRVFDLFNPVMGAIVDRTHTRFGKGRPWLLWLAVPFGIVAVLLFSAPNLSPTGKIVYAFITYNLGLALIFTAVDIPYTAMMSLISSDQHDRTMLSLFRMVMNTGGGMLTFALTLPMVKFFGGGATGWQRSFMVYGAIGTILLLVCFAGTKEQPDIVSHARSTASTRELVAALFKNKYWVMMACLAVTLFIMLGLLGSNIYYCRYVLGKVELFGPLMAVYQISIIGGMMMVGPMLKRFGKRTSALWGCAISALGLASIYFAPQNFNVVLVGTVIRGLGNAPLMGTMFAMVADTIVYGEWKFNLRTEGVTFGSIALTTKVAIGLGNAAVGFILAKAGYMAGAATQTAASLLAIKAMFLHLPLLLTLVMGVIVWFFALEKQYPAIQAELEMRRAKS